MRRAACSQAKWYCPLPPQFANWGTFPEGEGFVNNNLSPQQNPALRRVRGVFLRYFQSPSGYLPSPVMAFNAATTMGLSAA